MILGKKRKMDSGNICYHSVQNVACSHKTDIFPVILCGCEIWCVMSREYVICQDRNRD